MITIEFKDNSTLTYGKIKEIEKDLGKFDNEYDSRLIYENPDILKWLRHTLSNRNGDIFYEKGRMTLYFIEKEGPINNVNEIVDIFNSIDKEDISYFLYELQKYISTTLEDVNMYLDKKDITNVLF